jgi:twitching motility protein PilT
LDIHDLLRAMAETGSSDLHLKVDNKPCMRRSGALEFLDQFGAMSEEDVRQAAWDIMDERNRQLLAKRYEVDFAYTFPEVGRFRVNVYRQRGTLALALRRVPFERPDIAELGLPAVVTNLADEARGLVLVTGTAGSGKTTTLAAMIDHINRTRAAHVVTIEDPIEVLHKDDRCIIDQREIGIDTESYADALRHVVREDPNIILIGEMRDAETVGAAMTAAEIGNLVLSTLHTIDATETINRIIDFFPPHQQRQIRLQLAATLRGIVSQRLLARLGGGQVPAVEVMVMTATIREMLIDPDETFKIKDVIEEGEYYGMQSFDQSLLGLYKAEQISLDDAVSMSAHPQDFKIKIRQMGLAADADFQL